MQNRTNVTAQNRRNGEMLRIVSQFRVSRFIYATFQEVFRWLNRENTYVTPTLLVATAGGAVVQPIPIAQGTTRQLVTPLRIASAYTDVELKLSLSYWSLTYRRWFTMRTK